MTLRPSTWIAVACLAMASCTTMLPRGASDTPSPFETYDQAQAAAERIRPFTTRVDQLASLGFDPVAGRNVTVIPYPDIVARLAPYSGVALAELDPGIQQCIRARTDCRAYLFRFERVDRKREGPFLTDFLNIRRVTHTTGWSFEALVVVSGDMVLFRNFGGQPLVARVERQINPLGPLQPAGESVGSLLVD
jgi:hypothetical protein